MRVGTKSDLVGCLEDLVRPQENAATAAADAASLQPTFRFLAAHEMAVALGNKCRGLPFFHALTGCDTVSSFGGRGKKKAWKPGQPVIRSLMSLQHSVPWLPRKHLFTQNGRSIDALPPTREALKQHIKRAAYQAGYCWGQMMVSTPPVTGRWEHRPVTGGGSTPIMGGTYSGQPSQRQLRHVGNY